MSISFCQRVCVCMQVFFCVQQMVPEVGGIIGFLLCRVNGSLMSIITASEVRKVLATDAACSRQHLTTCSAHSLYDIRDVFMRFIN